jgi:hypothetical protein
VLVEQKFQNGDLMALDTTCKGWLLGRNQRKNKIQIERN